MMHGVSCQAANWRASQRWKCTIAESGWSTEPKVLATRVPQIPQLLCKNMQNGLSNLQHSNLGKRPEAHWVSDGHQRWSTPGSTVSSVCFGCQLEWNTWCNQCDTGKPMDWLRGTFTSSIIYPKSWMSQNVPTNPLRCPAWTLWPGCKFNARCTTLGAAEDGHFGTTPKPVRAHWEFWLG